MTSQRTTKSSVRVALTVLLLDPLTAGPVCGGEDPPDPYDVLYDVLMTRYAPDRKTYAKNETSPAIFAWSEFPFDDKTFKKFSAAMDAFAALPQKEIEAYSDLKRALMHAISGRSLIRLSIGIGRKAGAGAVANRFPKLIWIDAQRRRPESHRSCGDLH